MTSQWHPDATALAEYKAGLTGGRRAPRRLAAHVASCASCASVNDQLAAVTTVLASAPEPAMPNAVESRIMASRHEAALATEAALVTVTPHDTEAAHGTAAKRETALRPVGGTAEGHGGDRAADGPGRVIAGCAPPCWRARQPRAWCCSAACTASRTCRAVRARRPPRAVPRAPRRLVRSRPRWAARKRPAPTPPSSPPTAGRRRPSLSPRAAPITSRRRSPSKCARSWPGRLRPPPPAAEAAPSAQLSACVLHLTGQMRPSLVDRATYQGKPAYVIAVTNWAWVVGTGCTASNPELIASVGL